MASVGMEYYSNYPAEAGYDKRSALRTQSAGVASNYSSPSVSEDYSNNPQNMARLMNTMESSTATIASGYNGVISKSHMRSQSQGLACEREPGSTAPLPLAPRSTSVGNLPVKPRSNSVKHASQAHGTSNGVTDARSTASAETVIIEEHRRKPCGEGYTVHRYVRGRLLGKGGFAKVYLCTAMDTNKNYAVKIVPKANLVKARARQKLQTEIKIHRTLKHENVCEYKHFFEDKVNCYILLELCHNQSMNEMIKRRKRLTEPESAFFLTQILKAVKYMHEKCVIHRDLKLGNLFIASDMCIKVGDFGLATVLEDPDEKRRTICGTPNYIAPEVIQGDKATRGHSFEVDVWSMGVILYTTLIGKPPYEAKDVKATYQRILHNEYSFPPHVTVSSHARNLISWMLQSNPSDRPSLNEIASHSFLTQNFIPESIPTLALHVAPNWNELMPTNDDGDLKMQSKQPRRMPFGHHDPNTARRLPQSTLSKATVDDRDVVKGARSSVHEKYTTSRGVPKSHATPSSSGFDVYSDGQRSDLHEQRNLPQCQAPDPPAKEHQDLLVRTSELTLTAKSLRSPTPTSATTSTPSTGFSCFDPDQDILNSVVEQLNTVLEVTESNRGRYRISSPRPVYNNDCGPSKWVERYVDYTSKYGMGFLLNDGSSGVYFNDSTKTASDAVGKTFQYIERKRVSDAEGTRIELENNTYSIDTYPESLNKKVTLLKHFRNYLLEQQKQMPDETAKWDHPKSTTDLVYVKKWIRTKHAILFRLSNQTFQVVFYDQTEVLLTADDRYITYVNKNRERQTFHFTDELVGSYGELEKRLKYTKEILQQLLASQRR